MRPLTCCLSALVAVTSSTAAHAFSLSIDTITIDVIPAQPGSVTFTVTITPGDPPERIVSAQAVVLVAVDHTLAISGTSSDTSIFRTYGGSDVEFPDRDYYWAGRSLFVFPVDYPVDLDHPIPSAILIEGPLFTVTVEYPAGLPAGVYPISFTYLDSFISLSSNPEKEVYPTSRTDGALVVPGRPEQISGPIAEFDKATVFNPTGEVLGPACGMGVAPAFALSAAILPIVRLRASHPRRERSGRV